MMPEHELARQRQQDLLREAEQWRLTKQARRSRSTPSRAPRQLLGTGLVRAGLWLLADATGGTTRDAHSAST